MNIPIQMGDKKWCVLKCVYCEHANKASKCTFSNCFKNIGQVITTTNNSQYDLFKNKNDKNIAYTNYRKVSIRLPDPEVKHEGDMLWIDEDIVLYKIREGVYCIECGEKEEIRIERKLK